jgi:RNA polymerase sigma factor (TIGR02999 family)
MATADEEATALVEALGGDEDSPLDELFAAAYDRLRTLARDQRRRWRGEETLSTTVLVHEAYLKLSRQASPRWESRGHFFRVAARAMRHILINYAERRRTAKRGGDSQHLAVEEVPLVQESRIEELLAVDQALADLEHLSPRQARVVECRFFAGLDVAETAEALDVSPATVLRDWRRGKTWLYRRLAPPGTS